MREPPNLAATSWGIVPLCTGTLIRFFLAALHTLGYGCGNLIGLAQSPADYSVAVADYDDRSETERTSTLGDFRHSVDGYKAVLEFEIICRFYLIVLCHDSY